MASTLLLAESSAPRKGTRAAARVGGRSARVVTAVLRSTLEVLGRRGYAGLRIEDVAEESGVNKTTIYRRWATRSDLVIAALVGLAGPPVVTEMGRLECDLCATFMTATTLRATRAGRGVVRALIAERGDPEVDRVCAAIRERHRAPARNLLMRARRRGDLPPEADIELMLDVLIGTVYTRLRDSPRPLDEKWVRSVVRLVLAAVGRGPNAA
jgi:AcrR family transcriptional regulator